MAARARKSTAPAPAEAPVPAPAEATTPTAAEMLAGRNILGVDLVAQTDETAYAAFGLAEDGRIVAAVAFKAAQILGRTSVKRWEAEHGVPRGTVQTLQIVGAVLLRIGPAATVQHGRDAAKVYGWAKSTAKFWQALGFAEVKEVAVGEATLPAVPPQALAESLAPAAAAVTKARADATADKAAARPNDGTGNAEAANAKRTNVQRWTEIAKVAAIMGKAAESTEPEDGEADAFRAAYAAVVSVGRARGWLTPRSATKATPAKAAAPSRSRRTA